MRYRQNIHRDGARVTLDISWNGVYILLAGVLGFAAAAALSLCVWYSFGPMAGLWTIAAFVLQALTSPLAFLARRDTRNDHWMDTAGAMAGGLLTCIIALHTVDYGYNEPFFVVIVASMIMGMLAVLVCMFVCGVFLHDMDLMEHYALPAVLPTVMAGNIFLATLDYGLDGFLTSLIGWLVGFFFTYGLIKLGRWAFTKIQATRKRNLPRL